jgi:hypothetical protein
MKRKRTLKMGGGGEPSKTARIARRTAREVVEEIMRNGSHTPVDMLKMSE